MTFGTQLPASEFAPLRSLVSEPETSIAGNVILRVGRENEPGGTFSQTEYIVLHPDEAEDFARRILAAIDV